MTDSGDSKSAPRFDLRPWGSYTVLDEGADYKVKRIEVLPGKRLSYQKHSQRVEHWIIVQGLAKLTLDGIDILMAKGETIVIPRSSAHRIENLGTNMLVFIEVQRGSYLGEDDIVRLEDDYGRVKK
jgi:mannose-6-phosphate isomerase